MDTMGDFHGRPALRLAVGFLQTYLNDPSRQPGERIPPARRLAAMAGVSFTTMCAALREMRAAGILTSDGGRIHRIASDSRRFTYAQSAHERVVNKRTAVAEGIADDILSGLYRQGAPLPSQSELQGKYGVTYRTVRRALEQLVNEKILERPAGGGFCVPTFETRVPTARIVCFVPSYDSFSFAFGQHSEQIFRAFELQCLQANIEIDLNFVFPDVPAQRYRFRHRNTGRVFDREELDWLFDESVLGYVYLYSMMDSPFDVRAEELALSACAREKRPICLFDENDYLRLPHRLDASPNFRKYTAAVSIDPGREVGRRLVALGHRRIAFISSYPEYRWSQLRFEGLKSVFTDAGSPDGVVPFVAQWRIWHESGAERSNMASLRKSYRAWREQVPDICRGDFDRAFEKLRFEAAIAAEMHFAIQPLLEQALADPRITAWAMVNDFLTTMALGFLQERGIRIPTDLSIISFDDSDEALQGDFTSYNFNHQAIAGAMLGFILKRKPYCEPGAPVPGFIMDRGTIGRAREAG